MLKIVVTETARGVTTLQLEGQVIGPWVDELERACGTLPTSVLSIDLSEVSFVERRGADLLRALGARGVPLVGCSPFVAEQLKAKV